jgi:hypothetical protein
VGKPEGKRQPGRPRPGGRIILKWIFKKWNGGYSSIFHNSVDKIQVSLKSDENNMYFT